MTKVKNIKDIVRDAGTMQRWGGEVCMYVGSKETRDNESTRQRRRLPCRQCVKGRRRKRTTRREKAKAAPGK